MSVGWKRGLPQPGKTLQRNIKVHKFSFSNFVGRLNCWCSRRQHFAKFDYILNISDHDGREPPNLGWKSQLISVVHHPGLNRVNELAEIMID